MAGTSFSFALQPALSLGMADQAGMLMQPYRTHMQLVGPDHILLDVDLLPDALQSSANIANDGHSLPKLVWDFSCPESHVHRQDANSLDIQDCMQLAQGGAATGSCQRLPAVLVQSATLAGCHCRPAAATGQPSSRPRRDCRPLIRSVQMVTRRKPQDFCKELNGTPTYKALTASGSVAAVHC